MFLELKTQLNQLVDQSVRELFPSVQSSFLETIDFSSDKTHGEFSSNVALRLSRELKQNPLNIATALEAKLNANLSVGPVKEKIQKIEVKKPGFINFFLSSRAFYDVLYEVFKTQQDYGQSSFLNGEKIQVEFVSANPTGPLSVAHARQAAVGNALANILKWTGGDVKKEFYVNDEGNQINILGQSIRFRALEILGQTVDFPENCYQGDYIRDMAKEFMDGRHIKNISQLETRTPQEFSQFGVDYLLAIIKQELKDFGVEFDIWSHQSKIATNEVIEQVLKELETKGFIYHSEGALWFKSTSFGDDKDRVVKKSDGNYTYLSPDIVYHKNKFERGFSKVINLWGPDHHGYIPRIKAAVQALGQKADSVHVLIVQLATIYRGGQPLSMSTRRGQYISLREVLDEVGADAGKFFFLMRRCEAHLDFDLELAKKQSPENPVYYVQYAHARIHSILEFAKQSNLQPKYANLQLIKEQEEIDLIRKIGSFPDILIVCAKQYEPFPLVAYLQELATCFHKFYDNHRVVSPEVDLSQERLALIDAIRIVLACGLKLLGVSTPTKM